VDQVNLETIRAFLTTTGGEFQTALIEPLPAAEADVLGGMTFTGSPARVFLSIVPLSAGGGDDAVVITALYTEPRIQVRVLRGGPAPLYGVFDLRRP
jgi:hypothetical protein